MADNNDKASPTGDEEHHGRAGRRREPRFDWETGDPIKDRRQQDESSSVEDDEPDR